MATPPERQTHLRVWNRDERLYSPDLEREYWQDVIRGKSFR
jgi:hypothetical protein